MKQLTKVMKTKVSWNYTSSTYQNSFGLFFSYVKYHVLKNMTYMVIHYAIKYVLTLSLSANKPCTS